jgi:hypothetical protein
MRSHFPFIGLVAWALSALAVMSPAHGQTARIPGTSVTMAVPSGFRLARGVGVLEDAAGSSIVIAEMPPDAYAQLAATFASPRTASNGFAAQGIKIMRIAQVAVDGGQIPLAIGDQQQNSQQFRKYITVMGGGGANAVLITFSLARGSSLQQSDVEAALKSVRITPVVTLEQKLAQLRFTFEAVPPFHTEDVLAGTTALLTTYDGTDPSGMKPVLMINRAPADARPQDTPQFAERTLRNMSGFADAELTEQNTVTFAGDEGYFIAAVGNGRTMLQFVRVFSNGTYVRVVARGETSAMEEARSAVMEIADSVEVPE